MSRLKEPRTWAGVSGAAAALAGVVAVYLREQSSVASDAPEPDAEASGSE